LARLRAVKGGNMEVLLGFGGVMVVLGLFGILSRIEGGRRRRMIQDVTRTPVRRYDLSGDLLPREETSLGPADYRRIPAAEPAGYVQTTQQARHAPTVESSFLYPLFTAFGSALACSIGAGALTLLFGWPAKVIPVTFGLSLALAWFWRLGFADKVLWSVESWMGKDLDGDGSTGKPALGFTTINGGAARATVARQTVQNATEARQQALQVFVDRCYLSGTSEGAHGITASGPDRVNYVACRDELLKLGLAEWKNPNRPKGGWRMVADPATAKAIVAGHVA
jgi:hypothetical protein